MKELLQQIHPNLDLGLDLDEEQFKLQWQDFQLSRNHKAFGVFNDVGTGKTVISLLYLAKNFVEGKKTIVVIPSSLMHQYSKSLLAVKGLGWSITVCDTSRHKRERQFEYWNEKYPDVVVMTPASLIDCVSFIRRCGYTSIVVDEAHMILGLTNKIRAVLVGLIKYYEYTALMMTATPHNSELASAYGMISVLNPSAYENYEDFGNQHIYFKTFKLGGTERKVIEGYHDVDRLSLNLFARSCRRQSSDVLKLSQPTLVRVEVALTKAHNLNISTLISSWLDKVGDDETWLENSQAVRQQALMRVTNPPIREVGFTNPLEALETLLESINPMANKVVIFCYYQRTIEYLAEKLARYNPALVYGGANSGLTSEKFKTDDGCRIVLANYQAGGVGHNWQHAANIIMYEPISDVKYINQAIGRCQRGGQTKPVVVHMMVYKIEMIKKIIAKADVRAELSRVLLGDQTSYLNYIPPGE